MVIGLGLALGLGFGLDVSGAVWLLLGLYLALVCPSLTRSLWSAKPGCVLVEQSRDANTSIGFLLWFGSLSPTLQPNHVLWHKVQLETLNETEPGKCCVWAAGEGLELVSGVWGYSVSGRTGLMGCSAAKK